MPHPRSHIYIVSKILLEDTWPFNPDRRNIKEQISESAGRKLTTYSIPGTFSVCDVVNGNGRIYPRRVWESNLKEDSHLQRLIKSRASFGLLEHPESGRIDLRSPISHMVTNAKLNEDGTVYGEVLLLDTPEGQKIRTLIENGYNPMVSSRGFGSVESRGGQTYVCEDFVCEGWDIVHTPSFVQAILTPKCESTDHTIKISDLAQPTHGAPTIVSETISNPIVSDEAGQLEETVKTIKTQVKMKKLGEIRESILSLKGSKPSDMSPSQISEAFNRADNLHREISAAQAEDRSIDWDAKKLHEELSAIEKGLTEAVEAPRKANIQLVKDQTSLVAVNTKLAAYAKQLHESLGKTAQKFVSRGTLLSEAVKRGKSYYKLSETLKGKMATLENRYEVATSALDILAERYKGLNKDVDVKGKALTLMAERYHADTTRLSRTLVEMQLGEKLTDEIRKKLDECKTSKDVLALQESMTPAEANETKPEATPKATKVEKTEEVKEVVAESKKEGAAPKDGKPATEISKYSVMEFTRPKIGSLDESMALVRRLAGVK
jgi:hypothetical protein